MKNSAIPIAARQGPVSELLLFAVPIAMSGIPIAMGLNDSDCVIQKLHFMIRLRFGIYGCNN